MMALMHPDESAEPGTDDESPPFMVGTDGIHLHDNARVIPPPPRLCEAGPCRHYHTFVTQLDAERPLAGAIKGGDDPEHGRLVGDGGPQPFHTKRHHYCYPDVGIETELEDMPVLECNRWEPDVGMDFDLRLARANFLKSEPGQKYQRELADWKAARAATESAPAVPPIRHVLVTIGGHDGVHTVDGSEKLRTIRDISIHGMNGYGPGVTDGWLFLDSQGNEITNLDATLHELGVADGERFILTRPAGHGG